MANLPDPPPDNLDLSKPKAADTSTPDEAEIPPSPVPVEEPLSSSPIQSATTSTPSPEEGLAAGQAALEQARRVLHPRVGPVAISKAPEPINPVRGSGSSRLLRPLLFQSPAPELRYEFEGEMSTFLGEHRDRITLAEIEAIEQRMTQSDGILHMTGPFIAGMIEHAIRNNWPADKVITNIDEFGRVAAIGQGMSDHDRQALRERIQKLPQYGQAIRDVAAAKTDRSQVAGTRSLEEPLAAEPAASPKNTGESLESPVQAVSNADTSTESPEVVRTSDAPGQPLMLATGNTIGTTPDVQTAAGTRSGPKRKRNQPSEATLRKIRDRRRKAIRQDLETHHVHNPNQWSTKAGLKNPGPAYGYWKGESFPSLRYELALANVIGRENLPE